MKVAVVIPTLNAMRGGVWPDVLSAVDGQTLPVGLKLVIDSSSDDQTRALAEAYGWRTLRLARHRFNHGTTRTRIVRALSKMGYESVVFLSQDVVLATPHSLSRLLDFLIERDVCGCYGKQVCPREGSYDAWQRERSYPDASCVKSASDIAVMHLRTAAFSNAFSAWRVADVLRLGGFPETDFGEDMLLAARAILAGMRTGYCAEAIAFHSHRNGLSLLWRGYVNGRFFARNRKYLRKFGTVSSYLGSRRIPIRILIPLAMKTLGYFAGSAVECLKAKRLFGPSSRPASDAGADHRFA